MATPPGGSMTNVPGGQWGGVVGAGGIIDEDAMRKAPQVVASFHELIDLGMSLQTGEGQLFGGVTRPVKEVRTPGLGPITSGGGSLGQGMAGFPQSRVTTAGRGPEYKNLRSAIAELHTMPADKLRALTQRLYTAGFYPDKSYQKGSRPPEGRVVTSEDIQASINLITTAQNYVEIDPKTGGMRILKTIEEIINESVASEEGKKKLDAGSAGQQGRVYSVETSDPATLRAQVTRTAQAILGRAVSDDEQNALVQQMLTAERSPQEAAIQAGQKADLGGDVRLSTARVDAEARMAEQIQAQDPTEAQAYSELNYTNILRQMMGGGG